LTVFSLHLKIRIFLISHCIRLHDIDKIILFLIIISVILIFIRIRSVLILLIFLDNYFVIHILLRVFKINFLVVWCSSSVIVLDSRLLIGIRNSFKVRRIIFHIFKIVVLTDLAKMFSNRWVFVFLCLDSVSKLWFLQRIIILISLKLISWIALSQCILVNINFIIVIHY